MHSQPSPEDEPGERIPCQMSELQEDGGQGEGDEETGGEAWKVRDGGVGQNLTGTQGG